MKKKTAAAVISFLCAAVLVLGIVSFVSVRRARQLEYYARASTQRAFSELVGDINELSDDLEKCVYISDSALQSALCTQVYGKSLEAQMALGALPYESQALEQAAGFISRVGDYACVLSRSVGGNGGYSEQELDNLRSLSETAGVMAGNLRELQMQLANGTMTMDTALLDTAAQDDAVQLSSSIADIENEFPELPTLIYDGPFSDGIRTDDPKLLRGQAEVDEEQARERGRERRRRAVLALFRVGRRRGIRRQRHQARRRDMVGPVVPQRPLGKLFRARRAEDRAGYHGRDGHQRHGAELSYRPERSADGQF